jgi:hypothetical protein
MAIVNIVTMLTHTSGQVLTTAVQTGRFGINSITRAIGSVTSATGPPTVIFLQAFLRGLG